jgi:hypothetical protein
MSSNVISLFEVRRGREAQSNRSDKSELPVQLYLPFDVEGSASDLATSTVATQSPVDDGGDKNSPTLCATRHTRKYLFLVSADAFAFQDDFLNFCKAMSPDLVVDLRVAPRLDFVRPMRKQAFELFEMCGIEYRDMLGRLNATTYDLPQSRFEDLIDAVTSLHTSHDERRPTVALFDNQTFAQFCTAKLARSLSVVSLDTDAIRRMVAEGARARM